MESFALDNLFNLTKVFELASRLNINFGNSELLGINNSVEDIETVVRNVGCKITCRRPRGAKWIWHCSMRKMLLTTTYHG